MRNLLVTAGLLLTAACSHTPTLDELAGGCAASGYAAGTEGGLMCLQMAVAQETTRQAAADRRRMAAAMMLGAMGQRYGQPSAYQAPASTYQPPLRLRTSCRPNPWSGGFTCN